MEAVASLRSGEYLAVPAVLMLSMRCSREHRSTAHSITTTSQGKIPQRAASAGCSHTGLCACADRKIMLLGAVQSLFEASMYTFVFLWTPALSPNGEKVAHGMIFACFMMSCMAGSTIAGRLLSDSRRYSVSHYMKVDLTSVAHGVPRSQLCEGGPAHAASTLWEHRKVVQPAAWLQDAFPGVIAYADPLQPTTC